MGKFDKAIMKAKVEVLVARYGDCNNDKRDLYVSDADVPTFTDTLPANFPLLRSVSDKWSIPIVWEPMPKNRKKRVYGNYMYGESRRIVLRTYDVSVFWHELMHAAEHIIWGDDAMKGGVRSKKYAMSEIKADFGSYVLASLLGESDAEFSANVKSYVSYYGQDYFKSLDASIDSVLYDVELMVNLIMSNA